MKNKYKKHKSNYVECKCRTCNNVFIPNGNQKFCSPQCGYLERKFIKMDDRDKLIKELSQSLYEETDIGK